MYYLIKWEGYPSTENISEPEQNLTQLCKRSRPPKSVKHHKWPFMATFPTWWPKLLAHLSLSMMDGTDKILRKTIIYSDRCRDGMVFTRQLYRNQVRAKQLRTRHVMRISISRIGWLQCNAARQRKSVHTDTMSKGGNSLRLPSQAISACFGAARRTFGTACARSLPNPWQNAEPNFGLRSESSELQQFHTGKHVVYALQQSCKAYVSLGTMVIRRQVVCPPDVCSAAQKITSVGLARGALLKHLKIPAARLQGTPAQSARVRCLKTVEHPSHDNTTSSYAFVLLEADVQRAILSDFKVYKQPTSIHASQGSY
ncbi:hypothetical protein COCSUDRAFT_45603 [Coccomyxa subellipsoidea C-169]|uniref:Chromo domain-containing protein n=1 Tax=Coccomyxa subellipsoidea (strain C-169) TaxID=574566 RepID=I0YI39_COCSC|nr:hypothetical protein COCSUDRAFT_45603 [Coccomyxa subellipsoidea C-169]EIE18058.1 hypothetical protein COCSUDRAFT_45603 [Coccomyxa subellipsoidea C-169]|eukprot:XP_005642602.1 hypothetical protein COCSUDRAFT_45603 [Coccomyxa subellipsoidea C-169]